MKNSKTLVVYFSRADENYNVGSVEIGNTEILAKEIINETGADEFKIMPLIKYPASYMETVELATKEKESDARPEYVGEVSDFSQYETIFLGYPIWWGDMPMIVYSFLEKHDFAGKTVAPFCTHEGSGEAGTFRKLDELLPNSQIVDGFETTGSRARTEIGKKKIMEWAQGICQE